MAINSVLSSGVAGMQKSMQDLQRNTQQIAESVVRTDNTSQNNQSANAETGVETTQNTGGQGSVTPTDNPPRVEQSLVEQKQIELQFKASARVVETGVNIIDTIINNA